MRPHQPVASVGAPSGRLTSASAQLHRTRIRRSETASQHDPVWSLRSLAKAERSDVRAGRTCRSCPVPRRQHRAQTLTDRRVVQIRAWARQAGRPLDQSQQRLRCQVRTPIAPIRLRIPARAGHSGHIEHCATGEGWTDPVRPVSARHSRMRIVMERRYTAHDHLTPTDETLRLRRAELPASRLRRHESMKRVVPRVGVTVVTPGSDSRATCANACRSTAGGTGRSNARTPVTSTRVRRRRRSLTRSDSDRARRFATGNTYQFHAQVRFWSGPYGTVSSHNRQGRR